VIVPEHVEETVHGETLDLLRDRAAGVLRLPPRHGRRDEDLAEQPPGVRLADVGERQDVGRAIDATEVAIQPAHRAVADERDREVAVRRALGFQRGAEDPREPAAIDAEATTEPADRDVPTSR
jgi:hypothetical protein